jgi:hypothetical protein
LAHATSQSYCVKWLFSFPEKASDGETAWAIFKSLYVAKDGVGKQNAETYSKKQNGLKMSVQ